MPDFSDLRTALIGTGIAPDCVDRTLSELEDHFDDLVEAERAAGATAGEAEQRASELLGDTAVIAAAFHRRGELKSWAWRWPRVACFVYPMACLAVLPAVPVLASAAHAPAIRRWAGGVFFAAVFTAVLLRALTLSIIGL